MTGKTRYYRGVGEEYIFRRFITRFNVPLSTTTNFTRASEFTDSSGLVMELSRYNEYISGLDCSVLSSFDHEKEVLFFGGETIFRLRSIFQWYKRKWTSYKHYVNAIQTIINIAQGSITWNSTYTNDIKNIIGHLLPDLYVDSEQIPPYIESLLNYHVSHLTNEIEYDYRELMHQYTWVQHIFVKDDNIPNVANACNLFPKTSGVTFIMSQDHAMDLKYCTSIVSELLKVQNNDVVVQFAWTDVPRPLDDIADTFRKCGCIFKEIDLKIQTNISKKSITIVHTIDMTKILPVMNTNPLIQSRHKQKNSPKSKIAGYDIISRFIDMWIKLFIPDALILIIYKYGASAELNWLISKMLEYYRTTTVITDLWQTSGNSYPLYDPQTQIIAESKIVFSERDARLRNVFMGYEASAILTDKHVYFISGVNVATCAEFQRRSKIDEVLQNFNADENTIIDREMAVQLAHNLDLVQHEEFVENKIVPCFIGLSKRTIVMNVWYSEINFKSVASLFGIFSISTGTKLYNLPEINDWRVNDLYNEENLWKISGKCKVVDLSCIEEVNQIDRNAFLFVALNPKYVEYKCEFTTEDEHDEWLEHFQLISENLTQWHDIYSIKTQKDMNDREYQETTKCNCSIM
eukprot:555460_1